MTLVTRQALFHLADGQQIVPLGDLAQLANQSDVLGHVAAQLLELGIFFDKASHIRQRLDRLRIRYRLRL